jgi:hypothetical protein
MKATADSISEKLSPMIDYGPRYPAGLYPTLPSSRSRKMSIVETRSFILLGTRNALQLVVLPVRGSRRESRFPKNARFRPTPQLGPQGLILEECTTRHDPQVSLRRKRPRFASALLRGIYSGRFYSHGEWVRFMSLCYGISGKSAEPDCIPCSPSVTVAPSTSAPDVSVTVPSTEPVATPWACAN